jgi:hypothetical protein
VGRDEIAIWGPQLEKWAPQSLGDLTTKYDLYWFGQFMLGIYGNAEYNGWLRNLLDSAGYDSYYKWISRADSMRVFAGSISHESVHASNQVLTGWSSIDRSIDRKKPQHDQVHPCFFFFLSVWSPNINDIYIYTVYHESLYIYNIIYNYIIYTACICSCYSRYIPIFLGGICRFDSMMCQLLISKYWGSTISSLFCWLYNISHQIISL